MNEPTGEWANTVAQLLALADRLEGHGLYNIAKMARATADSLSRRAAFALNLPHDPQALANLVSQLPATLAKFDVSESLVEALRQSAITMIDGGLPLYDQAPDPFVCRACGTLLMAIPQSPCPTCGAWPATFQRFRPVYWLDALEAQEALVQLRRTPESVALLLAGLTEQHLSKPAPDYGWSMRQLVSHLRDAEGVLQFRVRLMIEQDNPVLESLAVFAWAASEENRPQATMEIYRTYNESRRETLALLEALPAWDWWRTGQHLEFGELTIRQQASYFSAHEQTHLAALETLSHTASD